MLHGVLGGTVIEYPKDTLGSAIEGLSHHVFDESIKAGNSIASLAAAKELCTVHIHSSNLGIDPA